MQRFKPHGITHAIRIQINWTKTKETKIERRTNKNLSHIQNFRAHFMWRTHLCDLRGDYSLKNIQSFVRRKQLSKLKCRWNVKLHSTITIWIVSICLYVFLSLSPFIHTLNLHLCVSVWGWGLISDWNQFHEELLAQLIDFIIRIALWIIFELLWKLISRAFHRSKAQLLIKFNTHGPYFSFSSFLNRWKRERENHSFMKDFHHRVNNTIKLDNL